MEHIAIMKKGWKLTQKVINGEKTVEARWYKYKVAPWNKIKKDDLIFFKDTGSPIVVKAVVTKVEQFDIKSNQQALDIMNKYALADLGTSIISESIKNYITNKRYVIFVHFTKVEKTASFDIRKKGFGMQCAWIVVDSVNSIKKRESKDS